MSNGSDEDGEDLVVGRTNRAQSGTELLFSQAESGDGNDFIFRVRNEVATARIGAIRAQSGRFGVIGDAAGGEGGGTGLMGRGLIGVEGQGDDAGVKGFGGQRGVLGQGPVGVKGQGLTFGILGDGIENDQGILVAPVAGVAGNGVTGVVGTGKNGVQGVSDASNELPPPTTEAFGNGVIGKGRTGVQGLGTFVGVKGIGNSIGVDGENVADFGIGVLGTGSGLQGIGVAGASNEGVGVLARGNLLTSIALFAHHGQGGLAGFFVGQMLVQGGLTVVGSKSAAVPHPDGSHRLLYCVESPESWFEDFGEEQLVDGKAEVRLDPDFVAVIKSNRYHVFVTPYGNSNGLYVTHRNSKGFRVREQNDGKGNVTFSYRVVAKRKGIKAERFAKVTLPEHPTLKVPKPPRKAVGKRRSTSDSSSYHKPSA